MTWPGSIGYDLGKARKFRDVEERGRRDVAASTVNEGRPPAGLLRNALSGADVVATSLAQIAPTFSLLFASAGIVAVAGLGSPLVVLLAGIAFFFHVNSTAQFSRVLPSAGSYVTYLGRTFGKGAAAAAAAVALVGYLVTDASVVLIPGYWTAFVLHALWGLTVAWWIPFVLFNAGVYALMFLGVKLSTRWAIWLFVFEMFVLAIALAVIVLSDPGAVNLLPFSPAEVLHGWGGVATGFPLAIYMFTGASNSAPMAEETVAPRRNVPRAVFRSVIFAIVIYVVMVWATLIGFRGNAAALSAATLPLVTAVQHRFIPAVWLLYLGGLTSTLSALIVAQNAHTRIYFSAARDGLIPKMLSAVGRFRTPVRAIGLAIVVEVLLTLVWGLASGPLNAFDYLGTLGTIIITILFIAVNVALPVYYWGHHRDRFSYWLHAAWPILGIAALGFPLVLDFAPGQPVPYNVFPYVAVAVAIAGTIYGFARASRHPEIGSGTYLADDGAVATD